MVDVAMPNGDVVAFPDDMPKEQIRSLIEGKFPGAERQALADTGVKPYDSGPVTMGKAALGVPGNIGLGLSGTAEMLRTGEAGDPNAVLDKLGPDFDFAPHLDLDQGNLKSWAMRELGVDPWKQDAETNAKVMAFVRDPATKAKYEAYLRNPDSNYIGAPPAQVAKEELRGKLERQQINKVIPPIDARPGSPEEFGANLVSSVGQMAPGYAASLLTRNALPAVALAQVLTSGTAYGQAIEAGLPPGKAAQYAVQNGFAEAVGEALPLGMILKEGGKLLPKLFKAGVAEGTQEAVTQFIQSMLQSGSISPEMTWGDVKDQVIQAAGIGAVTGVGLSAVASIGGKQPTAEDVSKEVLGNPEVKAVVEEAPPIEEQLSLPAPQALLALPSPDAFTAPDQPRRQPSAPEAGIAAALPDQQDLSTFKAAPSVVGGEGFNILKQGTPGAAPQYMAKDGKFYPVAQAKAEGPQSPVRYASNAEAMRDLNVQGPGRTIPDDDADKQARVALQKTKQAETAALLQTARETVSPLGSFTTEELPGDVVQRVNAHRSRTGRNIEAPISVADLANARVPQSQIDALIGIKRPLTSGEPISPLAVARAAKAKNIITTDDNFRELAYRTTGSRDITKMTQSQLGALQSVVDSLPAHDTPVTVPVIDEAPFTEAQYGKAVDALRKQGRYTLGAIKEATGLKTQKDAAAVRDAMVRRGQLVQHSPSDFRLYDVLGQEKKTTPDELPPGAFKEHVVKRVPVSKLQLRKDGKLLDEKYGSPSETRERIAAIRAEEESKGKPQSKISIEPAGDVGYGVLENRYDEQGNLLGQVLVDSHREEAKAREAADRLNSPEVGARYTQTAVTPESATAPPAPLRKPPPPAALAGRVAPIVKKLNALARDRKLPLLGVRVQLTSTIENPENIDVEGTYFKKLITLAVSHLDPSMTDNQIVDKLAQVMDHETIHALRSAGVLTPESEGWKSLVRYVKRAKRPGENETYMDFARRMYTGQPGYEKATDLEEEAIAEAFRAWAKDRRAVVGQPATVFRQLVEWFKRLLRSIPEDLFRSIESGRLVEEALTPPGSSQPRARATATMTNARQGVAEATAAQDENAIIVKSREFLRARAQAREDRYGRSGPKTVLGTTPSRAYATGEIANRDAVQVIADKYRADNGISAGRLQTLLPEDVAYLQRVADAQQRGVHAPGDNDVAKAYRALIEETARMFRALGNLEITAWTEDGPPYASPAEMFADIEAGRLKMRLSGEMFGEGAANPKHPMNEASDFKMADGKTLSNNDIFRVVHDVYGYGQSGLRSVKAARRSNGTQFVANDPRGQYNAYHEHARLLSPEARRALATETLAQGAWANYGPHLRRSDGTVPREADVDYLPAGMKEFAEQKAFLLDPELQMSDPGWALADASSGIDEQVRYMVGWHGTPHKVDKFSSTKIGTGEGAQAFGHGLYFAGRKEVAEFYRNALTPKQLVKQFRDALPDDADFADVMELVGTGHFTPGQDRVLRALEADGWLGFDYPSQAISAAYGKNIDNWDPSQELRDAVNSSGNLYKVDLPDDSELMDWDRPLSEQPEAIKDKIDKLVKSIKRPSFIGSDEHIMAVDTLRDMAREGTVTAEDFYHRLGRVMGKGKVRDDAAASAALREAGIPGHRYLEGGSRTAGATLRDARTQLARMEAQLAERPTDARLKQAVEDARTDVAALERGISHNYVIYDDNRIEILEENPKFSKFKDDLPGGRLYGNPNKSPGGQLSKPGTPSPAFTNERPANVFFGGEMADHQLAMAQDGERGTTMIYLSPRDFLALTPHGVNPEQAVYNEAVREGYKFSTLPSLMLDGYAGNVRVSGADGDHAARALLTSADVIPVVLYPKNGKEAGLVTALEGNDKHTVIMPELQEYDPAARVDGGPKYSLNAQLGQRVPARPNQEVFDLYAPYTGTTHDPLDDLNNPAVAGLIGPVRPSNSLDPDTFNIVHQRVEGFMGRFLHALGRSKGNIPFTNWSIFQIRTKIVDEKMLSVKEMMEHAKEDHGVITSLNDAYVAEMLYHGKVFEEVKQREDTLYMDVMNTIREHIAHPGENNAGKVTLAEVGDYLYAMHAPERNAYLRAKGSKEDSPSGMSDAEANTILDRFAIDGKLPALQQIGAQVRRVIQETNDVRLASGLISQEIYDRPIFQHYVPLRGLAADEVTAEDALNEPLRKHQRSKGFSTKGPADKKMKGRTKKAADILGHVFLQNTETIIRAEKNNVAKSFIRFILDNPAFGYGRLVKGTPPGLKAERTVVARVEGKDVMVTDVHPTIARAIRSDYTSISGGIVSGLGKFNRYLAAIHTAFSPLFQIRGVFRDATTAAVMAAQYDIKNFGMQILRDAPAAWNGIREVLFSGTANGQWAQAFRDLQRVGGTAEFLAINDLEQQQKKILANIVNSGTNPTLRQARNLWDATLGFMNNLGKTSENSFRLAAFVNARRAGATPEHAAVIAKRITVNFTQGSEQKTLMNALYLFYNANTAGSAGMLRGMKNRRVRLIAYAAIIAGASVDFLLRATSGDDDKNGVKDYDEISPWLKQTNWVIPNMFGGPNKYILLPMPYGFNIFTAMGRNINSVLSGARPAPDAALDQMVTTLEAFNPAGGLISVLNFLSPTALTPVVDMETNKNFTGAPIVPERPNYDGGDQPNSQKYYSTVGQIPKDVAAFLNEVTGGSEVRKGRLDISPESMEYVIDFLTPDIAKLGAETSGTAADILRGQWPAVDKIPIVRKFVTPNDNRANQTLFYQNANAVQTSANEYDLFVSRGDDVKLNKLIAEHGPDLDFGVGGKGKRSLLSETQKAISDYRKMRNTETDPAAIKLIDEAIAEKMAEFNLAYMTAKKNALN